MLDMIWWTSLSAAISHRLSIFLENPSLLSLSFPVFCLSLSFHCIHWFFNFLMQLPLRHSWVFIPALAQIRIIHTTVSLVAVYLSLLSSYTWKSIAGLIFQYGASSQESRLPPALLRNAQFGVLTLGLWRSWRHSYLKKMYNYLGISWRRYMGI